MLAGDPAADLALRPFDYLVIKEVPLWASQEEVEVRGEVQVPRAAIRFIAARRCAR